MRLILTAVASFVVIAAATARAQTRPATADARPTLFLVGDSTVKNGTKGQRGWGEEIDKYFDTSRINIANRANGGRSDYCAASSGRLMAASFASGAHARLPCSALDRGEEPVALHIEVARLFEVETVA